MVLDRLDADDLGAGDEVLVRVRVRKAIDPSIRGGATDPRQALALAQEEARAGRPFNAMSDGVRAAKLIAAGAAVLVWNGRAFPDGANRVPQGRGCLGQHRAMRWPDGRRSSSEADDGRRLVRRWRTLSVIDRWLGPYVHVGVRPVGLRCRAGRPRKRPTLRRLRGLH
jgi:hypothetical protein